MGKAIQTSDSFGGLFRKHMDRPSPSERFKSPLSATFLALALGAITAAAEPNKGAVATFLAQDPVSARLTGMSADGRVQFTSNDKSLTVATQDLVSWGRRTQRERGTQILLADGSVLVADVIDMDRDALRVESRIWAETRIPLKYLSGIVFYPPYRPLERDRLIDRIRTSRSSSDQLLLEGGDIVEGTLLANQHDQFRWETSAGLISIGVERVRAMIFNKSLIEPTIKPKSYVLIGTRNGSLFATRSAEVSGSAGQLNLIGGVRIKSFKDVNVLNEIVSLRTLSDRVTYLSDLQPAGYKHVPALAIDWPYRNDRNVLGGQLRTAAAIYTKGLGMHSTSRITYRLDENYRRFEAEIGIDDQSRGQGSVNFRVFTRGDDEWKIAYLSPIVRGGGPPISTTLELSGVRGITLVVDFADRGDQLDYANWLNARLIK